MKLTHLSDKQLLNDTLFWSNEERAATSKLLWHLKEIDERRLYSIQRCSSLFDYCLRILKYSEGQASRRVSACRLLKQLPELIVDIENGDLNLTQLNMARQFFRDENINDPDKKKEILDKLKNKTTRETDRVLWEMKKSEKSRKVAIFINEGTEKELQKLQALKAHSCPDMDTLLMKMCTEVGKLWDPTVIHRHRKVGEGHTRYVPVQVKAKVWERDKGKCTNCGSERMLEVDHVKPFAAGGKTVVENLRLLCWGCNQRKSLEYFGLVGTKPNLTFK